MSAGQVTTARGDILNLDLLIEQSKRPIGYKEPKSEVAPRPSMKKRVPINVRGFSPSTDGMKVPEMPAEIRANLPATAKPATPSAFRRADDKTAQSLADLTGVRVDKPKHVRVAAEGEPGMAPADYAQSVALSDIMGGLQAVQPQAVKAAEDISRKAKSKRTKTEDDDADVDSELAS